MKAKALILGALLLAPVTGGLASQLVSTKPLTSTTDLSTVLPQHAPLAVADATPRTQARLPDHYAMETPEGRVEVHELAMRGRNHDRFVAMQEAEEAYERELAVMEARRSSDTGYTQPDTIEEEWKPNFSHVKPDAMAAAQTQAHVTEVGDGVIEIARSEERGTDPTRSRMIDVSAEIAKH